MHFCGKALLDKGKGFPLAARRVKLFRDNLFLYWEYQRWWDLVGSLFQIGVARDPQAKYHLQEVLTTKLSPAASLYVCQSPLQLPVLILNLSNIFLLPVTRVLRRHAVALLLPGLLRFLRKNKGGDLRLFYLQLQWCSCRLVHWRTLVSNGGSEPGMIAFEFQFQFPGCREDFSVFLRRDAVVLGEVVHDLPETSGTEAEVFGRLPNHLPREVLSCHSLLGYFSLWGILNEIIDEGIIIVFAESEEGVDEVVVAVVLELEVEVVALSGQAVHPLERLFQIIGLTLDFDLRRGTRRHGRG